MVLFYLVYLITALVVARIQAHWLVKVFRFAWRIYTHMFDSTFATDLPDLRFQQQNQRQLVNKGAKTNHDNKKILMNKQ